MEYALWKKVMKKILTVFVAGLFLSLFPVGCVFAQGFISDITWNISQVLIFAESGFVHNYTMDEAEDIGESLGIDWDISPFGVNDFRVGLEVEMEHGSVDPRTNVTDDDPLLTGKIALAHLNALPDYYFLLTRMENIGMAINILPNIFLKSDIRNKVWEDYKSTYLQEIGGMWHYTMDEAEDIGKDIGIDWNTSLFDIDAFRVGLEVELEHGLVDPSTNVTNDDSLLTGKIAWAHLNEMPDYYFRLLRM